MKFTLTKRQKSAQAVATQKPANQNESPVLNSAGKNFLPGHSECFALGVLLIAVLFLYYAKDLPDPNKLLDRNVPESTKIYARDGSLLYEIHGEYKRTLVTLDQIPAISQHATIAIEDKDFYKEGGVSLTGIARAVITDILSVRKSPGRQHHYPTVCQKRHSDRQQIHGQKNPRSNFGHGHRRAFFQRSNSTTLFK